MPRLAKLAKLSVEDLKKEIVRRQSELPDLIAKRDALDKEIAELQALGEAKAAPKRAGRKPGKKRGPKPQGKSRPGSLSTKLVEVLQDKKSLSVAEAIEAVLASGYKTKAKPKSFRLIVNQMLSKDKRFKRVGRGVYALKLTAIGQRKADMGNAVPRVVKLTVVKPAREGSLSSKLVEALGARGKLTVTEATEAVVAAGYKSKSKDLGNIVSMTLSKDKRFRRVRRGVYALKG